MTKRSGGESKKIEVDLDSKKLSMKLRSFARHSLALADELDEIDSLDDHCEELGGDYA